jgi:hypothetical protein
MSLPDYQPSTEIRAPHGGVRGAADLCPGRDGVMIGVALKRVRNLEGKQHHESI